KSLCAGCSPWRPKRPAHTHAEALQLEVLYGVLISPRNALACPGACPTPFKEVDTMADDSGQTSKGGSRILRHAPREHGWQPPAKSTSPERVMKHLEPFLGKPAQVFHEVVSDQVQIDVNLFAPTERRPAHTLVTTGMSDLPMTVPSG